MPRVELTFVAAPSAKASQKGAEIDKLQHRANIKVFVPEADTVAPNAAGYTPAPSAAYICSSSTTFFIPARSTAASRKDVHAFTANAIAHAVVKSMVVDGESVW
jgi:hypothetical protein